MVAPNRSVLVWGGTPEDFYSVRRVGHGGWYSVAHQGPLSLIEEQKLLSDLVAAAQARLVQLDYELENTKLAELTEGRLAYSDVWGSIYPSAAVRVNLIG